MVMSRHDIPGEHVVEVVIPKLATATEGEWVVFRAPFACKVRTVRLNAGADWVGVNSATNYERFILYNRGTDGTGTTVLGSVVGSPSGTPASAFVDTSLYAPSAYLSMAIGGLLSVKLGTVGAGTTAPPAATIFTTFEGA